MKKIGLVVIAVCVAGSMSLGSLASAETAASVSGVVAASVC